MSWSVSTHVFFHSVWRVEHGLINPTYISGQFWHQTELVENACLGIWGRRRWGCLPLLWARRQLHHWLASKYVNLFKCAVLPGEQCRFIRSFCFRTYPGPGSTTYCVALDRSAFCASVDSSIKWEYEWALSPKVVERMKWKSNIKYLNLFRTHKQSKNKCWPFFLICRWVVILLRAFSNWACSALFYLLFLLFTGLFQRMCQCRWRWLLPVGLQEFVVILNNWVLGFLNLHPNEKSLEDNHVLCLYFQ